MDEPSDRVDSEETKEKMEKVNGIINKMNQQALSRKNS